MTTGYCWEKMTDSNSGLKNLKENSTDSKKEKDYCWAKKKANCLDYCWEKNSEMPKH
jgi:hypothetical protein